MAENDAQSSETEFGIHHIYLKDVSFESPASPEVFNNPDFQPKVDVQFNSRSKQVAETTHEVVLNVTVTATEGDTTLYLVEVQQGGLFNISGFSEDDVKGIIGSYCPSILYPYLRQTVSDMIAAGGFPPYYMAPVNFEALYRQHVQQQQAEENQ